MWNSRLYVRLQPKETTMFEEERKINLCYKVLAVTVIYLPNKDLSSSIPITKASKISTQIFGLIH